MTPKDPTPGLPTKVNTPTHSVMVMVPGYQTQESLLETRVLADSEDDDNPFSHPQLEHFYFKLGVRDT